jgi:hypothetical protein
VAAGLRVVVSPSLYTAHETFQGASAIHPDWLSFDWRRLEGGAV